MPNYNKVILMGNLTRDPELRYTPSGLAVADIAIAINRRTRTQEGERRDTVTFVDVTAWGRQAEVINEYFTKGRPIFLEGRLELDEWTAQDGQRRRKLRVVLEQFQFISARGDGREPDEAPPPGAPAERPRPAPPPGAPAERPRPAPPTSPPPPPVSPEDEADAPPFDDVPF